MIEDGDQATRRDAERWEWQSRELPSRDECVLRHLLERRARTHPDKVFVRFDGGEAWTYADTLLHARRAAAGLAALGVRSGDPVLVLLPNGPDFLRTWFGANLLGAALAALNTAVRGAQLQHLVTLSGARVGVIDAGYTDRLDGIDLGELRQLVVARGDAGPGRLTLAECMDGADPDAVPDITVEPWQPQFILFTSGTTGPSKGAIVTYVQMHDMVLATSSGRLSAEDVYLASTPLFHVGGTRVVYGMLLLGGSVALLERFRTETFWQAVRDHGATACVLIGAVARFLEDQPPRPDDRDHTLRLASMSPLVSDPAGFARRFGVDVVTSYGMSELSIPIVSEINPTDPASCGRLRQGYEARLVDEHDREVPEGEAGELIVRADRPWTISPGYWRMPEATAAAWRNGWFHTGDRLRRSAEGRFYFVDRQKDAIRRRGENISSVEVEDEIASHPAVKDVAVIGVPSPLGEEDVLAVVVLKPGEALAPEALIEHLRLRMAHYMVPRYLRFVVDLPRTPSARVMKHLLREVGIGADAWDREAVGVRIARERR
ncbi:AMP-binding protein [uncultured Sphingomonas sp.]|uniref:AMP-binding protein n=1 Tax=uncultured Sphingomonas sp. TaxID=158754 RepID=UPI0035CB1E6F